MAEIGYLLVGHGTRRQAGQSQFRAVFQQFETLLDPAPCELAFLELAEPNISVGVQRLAMRNAKTIVVVPVLLFSAGHARQDIPAAVQEACHKWGVRLLVQTPSLGLCQPILELSATRFRQAVCRTNDGCLICNESCSGRRCPEINLIMIGRGSDSQTATREMRRFTQIRHSMTPTATVQTAFIYGQQPTVREAMEAAARDASPRVVVQPHLLFDGLLSRQLAEQMAEMQRIFPEKDWRLTAVLGADEQLPRTLANLARSAASDARAVRT